MRLLCSLTACLWIGVFAAHADDHAAKVDALFATWDKPDSPGCAVGIIRDGALIYGKGFGMANLDHGVPNSTTTVYDLASVSKQFTAMSLAMLAREGKVSLDDAIQKTLTEFPDYGRPVTLRHLAHHTSGVLDYFEVAYLRGYRDKDWYSPEDTVGWLSKIRHLSFAPGEGSLYSNSGYFLIGEVVKRASGKTLTEYAKEHIFAPLGMDSSLVIDDQTLVIRNRAMGYSRAKDGYRVSMSPLDHVGDGSVLTTIEDLVKWDQAFYSKVLGEDLMTLVQTSAVLNDGTPTNYGFGLFLGSYKGLKTVGHGGAWAGFRSDLVRFPEQRFTAIILTNLAEMQPDALTRKIADIYLDDLMDEKAERVSMVNRPQRQKLEPPSGEGPSAESLKEFAGGYRSDEFEIDVAITLETEKGLVFHRLPGESEPMKWRGDDQFATGGGIFTFTRDAQGAVTGFTLDLGRALNNVFVKTASGGD